MKKIAIVAGGDSGEYEISMRSGQQVENQIDRNLFDPFLIEIRGDLWHCRMEDLFLPVDKNDFSIRVNGDTMRFDVVFNAIHGSPGEDGKLQGYLDMLDIPYTSSNLMVSALTFNKSFCKSMVASYGIHTAPSVHLYKHQREDALRMLKDISLPCFVKPNCGGSSVGMTKVSHKPDLPDALDQALAEDDEVIVEEFIPGRELTCSVLRSGGGLITFPVCEIVTKKEFFDYEAKYSPDLTHEIVPAPVPEKVALKCQQISAFLYNRLNCKGIIRIDYILSKRTFCFLEINTVPGLTEASIVPKMIAAHGWSYTELVTRMIQECQ
ncbi:MAG: D-alanine--D-alanine ligase [Bacteroidetes bacterium]|nr:MAG: D-alanine--D-alanine ligase [Bacteroidota bacterium]